MGIFPTRPRRRRRARGGVFRPAGSHREGRGVFDGGGRVRARVRAGGEGVGHEHHVDIVLSAAFTDTGGRGDV